MPKLSPSFTPWRALLLVTVMLAAVAQPRASFADEDTTVAREHAQKGKAFMDLGKYAEAAAAYEDAYAAKPDPALLLNLAQAYRLAGNGDKALFFYRKYLQHVPKSPYRADIEEKIAALEKQSKGSANASGGGVAPPAAEPPQPQPLAPAPTTQQGWPPAAGNPAPGAPPPPPPAPYATSNGYPTAAPGAMTAPSVGVTSPPPAAPPAADHGQKLKLAGLVTGGAGVLAVVVGAVFGAQAQDAAQKINTAASNGEVYGTALQAEDSRGRSAQAKEIGFLVVGVAAMATGGFLYYFGGRQQHAAEAGTVAVSLLPAASASQLGAGMRVTF